MPINVSMSSSVLLIAYANHDLNMCRRDLFKVDLDEDYKAICSNKQLVALELFGDDLTERLQTVKERKKAAQQLTGQKRKRDEQYPRHTNTFKVPFLFQRGSHCQGRPQGKNFYQKQKSFGRGGKAVELKLFSQVNK